LTEIIAVANHKGGVGKTATAVNLAAIIASSGKKVLLIDMDPQGSASSWIGVENNGNPLFESISSGSPLEIEKTPFKNLDIVPGGYTLAAVEKNVSGVNNSEKNLHQAISEIMSTYAYVFIDCPPGLGFLTISALNASTGVLLPLEAHPLGLRGIADMRRVIEALNSRTNKKTDIIGVVPCRAHIRRTLHKEVMESLENAFPGKITPVVRENVSMAEAPAHCKPINIYAPNSNSSADYKRVAKWIRNNSGGR